MMNVPIAAGLNLSLTSEPVNAAMIKAIPIPVRIVPNTVPMIKPFNPQLRFVDDVLICIPVFRTYLRF